MREWRYAVAQASLARKDETLSPSNIITYSPPTSRSGPRGGKRRNKEHSKAKIWILRDHIAFQKFRLILMKARPKRSRRAVDHLRPMSYAQHWRGQQTTLPSPFFVLHYRIMEFFFFFFFFFFSLSLISLSFPDNYYAVVSSFPLATNLCTSPRSRTRTKG